MRIEEIDRNFISQPMNGLDLVFLEAGLVPEGLSGLAFYRQEGRYCRLPQGALPAQNTGVQELAWHTAGVQVRFRTTSPVIALQVELRNNAAMNHMPSSGQSGFDLYLGTGRGKRYVKTLIPPVGQKEHSGVLLQAGTAPGEVREVTINFPLYNGVNVVRIGLLPGADVLPPTPFAVAKPILFYGSSITQGGCASRPGNAYCQIVSRRFDAECLNFGFSGSARAELAMAEVLASLDPSVFVLDYDHNAPNVEHLEKTHAVFFRYIRERKPELPIVLVSRPDVDLNPVDSNRRKAIIRRTYDEALAAGDCRVYFVDGLLLFGSVDRDACTVDGCHPNDLGFYRMAQAITPVVEKALADSGQLGQR
ncbi:MAG: hypothetical protein GX937_11040 [Lentisphaerae bacterium]|jgi:lysophospholipase L1-like esterase|nr:hypothetical protein [Lentisphaerota bacterium]